MDSDVTPTDPTCALPAMPRRRQAALALLAAVLVTAALLVHQPSAHAGTAPKISFTFVCGGSTGDYGFSAVNTDLQAHTLVEHVEIKPSGSFDTTLTLAVGQPDTFNSTNALAGQQVRMTVTEGGVLLAKSVWMTQNSALPGCWKGPIMLPTSSTTTVVPGGLPKVTISTECDNGAPGVRWDAVNVDLKKHYLHTILHSGMQLFSDTVLMGTNQPTAFSSYGAYNGEHIQMTVEEAGTVLATSPTYIIDTSQPDCLQKKDGPGTSTTTTTIPSTNTTTTSTTIPSTNTTTTTTSTTAPSTTTSTTAPTTTTSTTTPSTTSTTSTTEPSTSTSTTLPDPSTTVVTDTVPHGTVPPTVVTTTEPATTTTVDATTVPKDATTTTAGPAVPTSAPSDPPTQAGAPDPLDGPLVLATGGAQPAAPNDGPLARTGSALAPLALAGSMLLLLGLALVDARRRLDQHRR